MATARLPGPQPGGGSGRCGRGRGPGRASRAGSPWAVGEGRGPPGPGLPYSPFVGGELGRERRLLSFMCEKGRKVTSPRERERGQPPLHSPEALLPGPAIFHEGLPLC